jgi:intracellular multiplication protein IcmT
MATKAAKESEIEQANWHWRNTMRPVRFFNLDARAGLPFFFLLIYARPITLVMTLLMTVIFWVLERMGLTFPCALRALRVWIVGQARPGWVLYRHRRMRDYG